MNMTSLFEVRDLCVDIMQDHLWRRRPRRVLRGVSFSVGEGQAVAYLGRNGAGKTTTFRAMFGLAARASGHLRWKGEDIAPERLGRRVGFLPEHPYFSRHLTPRELLLGLGRMAGMPRAECARRLEAWARRLDFEAVLDRPMRTCSKGQLQRVGLAQALMHRPKLVVLDEPLSGLDPLGRELVREVLREVAAEGAALVFSSHILADAELICDKVVALQAGRVIFEGAIGTLLRAGGAWHMVLRGRGPASPHEQLSVRRQADGSWLVEGSDEFLPLEEALRWALSLPDTAIVRADHARPRLEDAFLKLLENQNHVE